jgi:DNA-binding response OmpR family regulator
MAFKQSIKNDMELYSKKILIIDDDELTIKNLKKILRETQHEIIIKKDGKDGLDFIKQYVPDLLILDLLLPRISGFDLINQLRTSPEVKNIPALVLSSLYIPEVSSDKKIVVGDRIYSCPADGFLSKPPQKTTLLNEVNRLLNGQIHKTLQNLTTPSILIAEDNENNLELLKVRIESGNFRVFTAKNGIDALELFYQYEPDVVLLDIQLPGLNGVRVLEKIRKVNKTSTIIIITAFGSEEIAVETLKKGANDYLTKPIEHRQIVSIIMENLEKQKLKQQNESLLKSLNIANRELLSKYETLQCVLRNLEENQEAFIRAQKLEAITGTVVSLNHEINNPLCTILGNTELLLKKFLAGDREIVAKLKSIENESHRIKDVTRKLANIINPILTEYPGGVKMIDIEKSCSKT